MKVPGLAWPSGVQRGISFSSYLQQGWWQRGTCAPAAVVVATQFHCKVCLASVHTVFLDWSAGTGGHDSITIVLASTTIVMGGITAAAVGQGGGYTMYAAAGSCRVRCTLVVACASDP